MIRKTISFSLIFLIIFLIYEFGVNMLKGSHNISYSLVSNEEIYEIDEKYTKDNQYDYYLIKVKNKDKNFVFEFDNEFNKQKNIVKNIETFEQDGFFCIGLKLAGADKYSYPECIKDNILYSYASIKNKVNFEDYLNKINDAKREIYNKESIKKSEFDTVVSRDYLDENETIIVYNYKIISLHYKNFSRSFSFSNIDNYKNQFGQLVGKYYVMPKLTSPPSVSTLVKYDIEEGLKRDISLNASLSKQYYINGVHDDKLYYFDKSNKMQYEFNPETDEINIVGSENKEGITYINGEKQTINVYDLDKSNVHFSEDFSKYSSIDYDIILKNDKYAVYSKNGDYYKVYNDYLDLPIYLFSEKEAKNVKLKGDNIYYLKNDSIYKYNDYGSFIIATNHEFSYNFDNIYDVYINEKM